MSDEIMILKEVAQYLKLAEKTAYCLAAEGKLPGFKADRSWHFEREEVGTLDRTAVKEEAIKSSLSEQLITKMNLEEPLCWV